MDENDPSPREVAVAYHEAGHAVVALALGRPVKKVSIQPNQLRLGQCVMNKGTFRSSKDALETEVLILLAGLAAEARHTGQYAFGGAAQDLRAVRSLTRQRAGSPRQVERLERRLLDKTEHLLFQPSLWRAVELIAASLLTSTTLSGRAAQHLFDQASSEAE